MHRSTARHPFLALLLSCLAGAASAQPAATPSRLAQDDGKAVIEQKAESITHEDAGSRIDELRVGGQTRRIEVQTKSTLPPYQVQPLDAAPLDPSQRGAGKSSWRLVNF
ncbi:MAG: hypothetical protein RLZZ22_1614 [Pseudomonadota bacterium]